MGQVEYRLATESDLPLIIPFVDFWIRGDGLADQVPGSAHDFFVPRGRHEKYVRKYKVLLAFYQGGLVGWAVETHKGVLIHLLVAGTFRSAGIGSKMLELMNPSTIRSKMDQAAGNPAAFYAERGYTRSPNPPQGKKHNIELFAKKSVYRLNQSDLVRRSLAAGGRPRSSSDIGAQILTFNSITNVPLSGP